MSLTERRHRFLVPPPCQIWQTSCLAISFLNQARCNTSDRPTLFRPPLSLYISLRAVPQHIWWPYQKMRLPTSKIKHLARPAQRRWLRRRCFQSRLWRPMRSLGTEIVKCRQEDSDFYPLKKPSPAPSARGGSAEHPV